MFLMVFFSPPVFAKDKRRLYKQKYHKVHPETNVHSQVLFHHVGFKINACFQRSGMQTRMQAPKLPLRQQQYLSSVSGYLN